MLVAYRDPYVGFGVAMLMRVIGKRRSCGTCSHCGITLASGAVTADDVCSERSFPRSAAKKGAVGATTALKSGLDAGIHQVAA